MFGNVSMLNCPNHISFQTQTRTPTCVTMCAKVGDAWPPQGTYPNWIRSASPIMPQRKCFGVRNGVHMAFLHIIGRYPTGLSCPAGHTQHTYMFTFTCAEPVHRLHKTRHGSDSKHRRSKLRVEQNMQAFVREVKFMLITWLEYVVVGLHYNLHVWIVSMGIWNVGYYGRCSIGCTLYLSLNTVIWWTSTGKLCTQPPDTTHWTWIMHTFILDLTTCNFSSTSHNTKFTRFDCEYVNGNHDK